MNSRPIEYEKLYEIINTEMDSYSKKVMTNAFIFIFISGTFWLVILSRRNDRSRIFILLCLVTRSVCQRKRTNM